jgi:predicted  nucleic acid-binding Zn-ribbon protein
MIILLLVTVIGLIIGFLYIKDKEMSQTIAILENSIDELQNSDNSAFIDSKYRDLESKIYEVGESLIKVVRTLKAMDQDHKDIKTKVDSMEEKLKLTLLSSSTNLNEQEIMDLYNEGKTLQEIAKQKRVPLGEVELIVKLANLNQDQ